MDLLPRLTGRALKDAKTYGSTVSGTLARPPAGPGDCLARPSGRVRHPYHGRLRIPVERPVTGHSSLFRGTGVDHSA
jgi:hypothetical protein